MATSTGSAIVPGEVEDIIEFVINRARLLQQREIKVDISDLLPLFKASDPPEVIKQRIRSKMRTHFREAKILQKFKGDHYVFTLDDSIDIDISKSSISIENELSPLFETTSQWNEAFIPPPWFPDLLDAFKLRMIPILIGPPGCGKTRILEEAYKHLGRTSYRAPLGQTSDPQELIGTTYVFNDQDVPITKFIGGLITHALDPDRDPSGVILDEFDCCSPTTGPAINNFLEPESRVPLTTEKGIQMFTKHPQGLISATSNTWGFGDDSGDFTGSSAGNRASWDRLHKMPCDYDIEIEKKLIAPYLPPKVIEALYNISGSANTHGIVIKLRKAIRDGDIKAILGFRPILRFAKAWKVYGWNKCLFYLMMNFRPEDHGKIAKIMTDRFGMACGPSRNTWDKNTSDYIPDMMPTVIKAGLGH